MAQTGFSPIQTYSSSTPGNTPTAGNLLNNTVGSELAINIADGKLFYKDSANAVQVIGWKTTPTTAGGTGLTSYTAGDLPYYASGTAFTKLGIGTSGYFMTSNGSAPQWTDPTTIAVTSISFGTTGLTPSTATKGAVTVAGTLVVGNGGTGLTTLTAGYIPYGNGTSPFSSASTLVTNGSVIGLGSALSSWGAGYNAIQFGSTGNVNFTNYVLSVANNAYYNGSIETTLVDGYQTKYTGNASTGDHVWYTNVNTVSPGSAISWTPSMTLFKSGGVSIGNTTDPGANNLRFNSTSNGIYFGSSSKLNDYEEGTWAPTITANSGTFVLVSATGTYTKVGRLVSLNFTITITTNGTAAGSILIGNLPFAPNSAYNATGVFRENNVNGKMGSVVIPNTTSLSIQNYDNSYPGVNLAILVGSINYAN